LSLLERVRERVGRKLGPVPRVRSCYEAGYDGYWLHRFLQANGVENDVFDPASIAVEQRSRRAKSDRIDGEQLLRTLMAYLRGEPRVVRIVRVPSPDQEDARRASRERDRLVGEQTGHTNRIKSLLRLHGFAVGNPRRRDWLARQRDWQGQPVPPQQLAEIEREHARLMLVREQIAALETPSAQAQPTPAAVEIGRRQETLFRLKSLGPAFTTSLTSEVFYKDFTNGRQVGSYVGLAPSPWRSGGIDREQGISKAGNPRARQKAIELAWLWLRHQPDSALTLWFRERTVKASKRIKRIAIVALARKLMVALWRFVTTGLVPTGARLKPTTA
jgi:transposase